MRCRTDRHATVQPASRISLRSPTACSSSTEVSLSKAAAGRGAPTCCASGHIHAQRGRHVGTQGAPGHLLHTHHLHVVCVRKARGEVWVRGSWKRRERGAAKSEQVISNLGTSRHPTARTPCARPCSCKATHCLPPIARLAHTQTHMQPRVQPTYGYVELVGGVCPDQARHNRLRRSIHTRLQREEGGREGAREEEADAHMSAGRHRQAQLAAGGEQPACVH